MADEKLTDQNVSEIDKAIAAAQARKNAKASMGEAAPRATKERGLPTEPAEPKRPKQTEEEKAAATAAREVERAARKAKRDEERAAKVAERNAARQPAHMKKVSKAAEKLGTLGPEAQILFNEATAQLPAAELATLALYIQHFNRVSATERALSVEIKAGMSVQVISGDPRFVGMTGTVVKAQRIRCYVNIPGANNRPVPGTDESGIYFFTSDVQAIVAAEDAEEAQAAGAEEEAPAEELQAAG